MNIDRRYRFCGETWIWSLLQFQTVLPIKRSNEWSRLLEQSLTILVAGGKPVDWRFTQPTSDAHPSRFDQYSQYLFILKRTDTSPENIRRKQLHTDCHRYRKWLHQKRYGIHRHRLLNKWKHYCYKKIKRDQFNAAAPFATPTRASTPKLIHSSEGNIINLGMLWIKISHRGAAGVFLTLIRLPQ